MSCDQVFVTLIILALFKKLRFLPFFSDGFLSKICFWKHFKTVFSDLKNFCFQVKTWFQNRRMKMKRKHSEAAERRAKLSFLNSLAYNMQPSFHGNQPYYPAPPPAPAPVLCPGLAPPEYAWSYQSPLNFRPASTHAARYLPPPSWEGLPEHTMDRYGLTDTCNQMIQHHSDLQDSP